MFSEKFLSEFTNFYECPGIARRVFAELETQLFFETAFIKHLLIKLQKKIIESLKDCLTR